MDYFFKIRLVRKHSNIATWSKSHHFCFIIRTRLLYDRAIRSNYCDINIPSVFTFNQPLDYQLISVLINIRIKHRYTFNSIKVQRNLTSLDEVYSSRCAACQAQK